MSTRVADDDTQKGGPESQQTTTSQQAIRGRQRIAFPAVETHTNQAGIRIERIEARCCLQEVEKRQRMAAAASRRWNQNKALTRDHAVYLEKQRGAARRAHATQAATRRKKYHARTRRTTRAPQQQPPPAAAPVLLVVCSENQNWRGRRGEGALSAHAWRDVASGGDERGALLRDRRALFRESRIIHATGPSACTRISAASAF